MRVAGSSTPIMVETTSLTLGLVVFAKHDPRLFGWEKLSAEWGKLHYMNPD
jgi:hypothetical protein